MTGVQIAFCPETEELRESKIDVRELTVVTEPLKVVSLFSGCGGLDLGLMGGFSLYEGENQKDFDTNPYEVIWANDMFKDSYESYKVNIGDHIIFGDINEIDKASIPSADIVIGGFPCQDFSISGKQQGFRADRGRLYQHMVEIVGMQKPLAFIAENVKNILSDKLIDPERNQPVIKSVIEDFEAQGYTVSSHLVYAPDYGVPQKRERVFLVGIRKDLGVDFRLPNSHHGIMTSKQAIDDLWGKENDDSIPNHNQMSLAKFFERKASGNQGNYQVKADEPSQTMRAEHHGNVQAHYRTYNPDNPLDRTAWRRLTVRECARLQSFPDYFKFMGSKTSAYKSVGNAVPPILGWYMGRALYKCLFPVDK